MSKQSNNDTPDTPDVSETELRAMKVDDLRERARDEGVRDPDGLHKEELVEAISELHRTGKARSRSGSTSGSGSDAGSASKGSTSGSKGSAGAGGSGNDTPDTPDLSETELREMKVDDLRERAREEGVTGTSSLRKEELVEAVSELHRTGEARSQSGSASGATSGAASGAGSDGDAGPGEGEAGLPGDAGPDGGRLRTGDQTSSSLKYSQEVTSPDDDPERAGRSLATTNHEVIRTWATERDAVPATVEGTEHSDGLGVLRLDFGGNSDRLRHVSWDEWFETFDSRRLNFLYQEERKDGNRSTFFRLESPDREDG